MNLELHATPEEVMRAVAVLQSFGEDHQVPMKELFGLMLALEECGSNIVNHALHHDPLKKFQVAFDHTGDTIIIELRDRGQEFDPAQAPVVALKAEDDRPPGGWGIQLVRRYTDEIRYRRQAGENVLRLTKRFIPAASPK